MYTILLEGEKMQTSRLFEIVYILLNKKNITTTQLAEHFEISRRTICRDIESLCQAGIPIYTTRGKGGGINLSERFVLDKSFLSEKEQLEIIASLQSLKNVNYPDSQQILSKLSGLFGNINVDWIELDFADWSNIQRDTFTVIKEAILEKKIIIFDYYGSDGKINTRIVEPLKLCFKENAWYLLAFCRYKQEIRTFKIKRIKNVSITDEYFSRVFSKDEVKLLKEPPQKKVQLKLWIDRSQSYRVYDEFKEEQITKNEDGSFIVSITFPDSDWVYGYIMSFGSFAKVLEPTYIKDIIKTHFKKSLEFYS
jgi:predicted DNA-binding transcriptional regulator YafY